MIEIFQLLSEPQPVPSEKNLMWPENTRNKVHGYMQMVQPVEIEMPEFIFDKEYRIGV